MPACRRIFFVAGLGPDLHRDDEVESGKVNAKDPHRYTRCADPSRGAKRPCLSHQEPRPSIKRLQRVRSRQIDQATPARSPVSRRVNMSVSLRTTVLALAASLSLTACYNDGYGYSGVSVGYGASYPYYGWYND